mgnify:FL=1
MMILLEMPKDGANNRDNEKYIKRLKHAYDNSIDEQTKRAIKNSIYHLEKELGR